MNAYAMLAWLAGLTGFGLLITGVVLISLPAGLITAGVLLLAWAYLADRASVRGSAPQAE